MSATPSEPMPTAYLAGPMTGIPEFNFPAFDRARENLRSYGWTIHCPAEKDRQNGFDEKGKKGERGEAKTYSEYMAEDLPLVCASDGIVLLPGWEESKGVRIEVTVALELGKRFWRYQIHGEEPFMDRLYPATPTEIALALQHHEETPPVSRNGTHDEVRVVDPETGAEKGSKMCQPGLIPPGFMVEVGKVYGFGAGKYAPWNWAKGYVWSLSFNALYRHFLAWLDGEDTDPESGLSHLAHVAWHAATLYHFTTYHPTGDDRWRTIMNEEAA